VGVVVPDEARSCGWDDGARQRNLPVEVQQAPARFRLSGKVCGLGSGLRGSWRLGGRRVGSRMSQRVGDGDSYVPETATILPCGHLGLAAFVFC
jgi:hypothetical protein